MCCPCVVPRHSCSSQEPVTTTDTVRMASWRTSKNSHSQVSSAECGPGSTRLWSQNSDCKSRWTANQHSLTVVSWVHTVFNSTSSFIFYLTWEIILCLCALKCVFFTETIHYKQLHKYCAILKTAATDFLFYCIGSLLPENICFGILSNFLARNANCTMCAK